MPARLISNRLQRRIAMKKLLFAFLLLLLAIRPMAGQERAKPIDANEKKAVVGAVADLLAKQYVFPETARKMGDLIRKNLKAGKYAVSDDPQAFAMKLTEDLLSISHDKHLGVRFAPERILEMRTPDETKKKAADEFQKKLSRMGNHGFKEVKILDGNVGYLKFNFFSDAQEAFPVAVGAMATTGCCRLVPPSVPALSTPPRWNTSPEQLVTQ